MRWLREGESERNYRNAFPSIHIRNVHRKKKKKEKRKNLSAIYFIQLDDVYFRNFVKAAFVVSSFSQNFISSARAKGGGNKPIYGLI